MIYNVTDVRESYSNEIYNIYVILSNFKIEFMLNSNNSTSCYYHSGNESLMINYPNYYEQ